MTCLLGAVTFGFGQHIHGDGFDIGGKVLGGIFDAHFEKGIFELLKHIR